MSGDSKLVAALRRALVRRNISKKAAAKFAGRQADTVERLLAGKTAKIDALMLDNMAFGIAKQSGRQGDRAAFLKEVFDLAEEEFSAAHRDASLRNSIFDPVGSVFGPVSIVFDAFGVADSALVANPLVVLRRHFDISAAETGPRDRSTILCSVCHANGCVVVVCDAGGTVHLWYDYQTATDQALTAAHAWISGNVLPLRPVWRHVLVGPMFEPQAPLIEHPSVTVAALARRILSRRIPQNIVVERFSLNETPMKLRRFLAVIAEPSDVVAAVARMGLLEHAHMYSAVQGEAIALQISDKHNLPTRHYIGMRVLDRPTDRDFAAVVDRHMVEAHTTGDASLYRLSAMIAGQPRDYWRLALPQKKGKLVLSFPWEPLSPRIANFAGDD